MLPEQYYNMLPKHFAAMVEGYSKKIYRSSSDIRRAAFFILLPNIKNVSYEKFCKDFWPLALDKVKEEKKGFEITHSDFETIMKSTNQRLSEARRKRDNHKQVNSK